VVLICQSKLQVLAQDNNKKVMLLLSTFITHNPIAKFMVNQRPFLLETLARINDNTFPFQHHLKMTYDFLSPPTHTCLLLFEQLIGQQMVRLQNSILECLHHHTFSSMLFNMISKTRCAQILSCFGPKAGVLVYDLINLPNLLIIFSIQMLEMGLGLPHPTTTNHDFFNCKF